MKPTDTPSITAKLSELEPGHLFWHNGKMLKISLFEEEKTREIDIEWNDAGDPLSLPGNTEVELILDQKEFREMESGQEFYDEHGLLHRRLDEDGCYVGESFFRHMNALCYYDNRLWKFDPHDPVFVVRK